ncbi:MAG: polysaccharide deacetylase family protein [Clostridia bacterium]|nr:polysaccharide deacetylase family protein [Clostridia bacterium]
MKKKLLLFAIIAITVLSISSCAALLFGNSEFDPASCVIIIPAAESDNSDLNYAASGLQTAFYSKHGVKPEQKTDENKKESGSCEVLIGKTDRALSAEALALLPTDIGDDVHAFAIVVKNGDIAIAATNDTAYKIAGRYFINNIIESIPKELTKTMFTTETIRRSEGLAATCYELSAMYSDIFIESVMLGEETFEPFDALKTSYDILLTRSEAREEIKINVPSFVGVSTTWKNDTQYDVTLTSMDKSKTLTYSFYFDRLEYDTLSSAKIEKIYGAKDAIVVIVHDDGTHATVDYMADVFEDNGLVGTLGLVTKNLASKNSSGDWVLKTDEVNYWRGILDRGVFDVASHSHTHSFWGITDEAESGYYLDSGNNLHEYSFEAGRITEEVAGSREILKMAFPDQDVLMMIKPGFGRVSDANGTKGMTQISDKAYEIIAANYIGMRDTGGGTDGKGTNGVNLLPLDNALKINSFTVKYKNTASDWQSAVNTAMKEHGMLVFLFHTIKDESTITIENPKITSESLIAKMEETDEFFAWLGEKNEDGDVWNTHLEDAVLYAIEYGASTLEAKNYDDRIEVSLTHELDESIYNHPLTVTVPVGADASVVRMTNGSVKHVELEIINTGLERCVRFNMVPNQENVILTIE